MRAALKNSTQRNTLPPSGVFAAILLGITAIGVGAFVFFFNPRTHGFYPVCMFHSLTGLNCPGCGMTRALYALLHGNFRVAMKDNILFVGLLAMFAVWSLQFLVRTIRHQPASWKLPSKFLWALLIVAVVFGVVRNLPGFEWLSP